MSLEDIKPFFPLVGPLVALTISVVVLPLVRQWFALYRERNQMIHRQFFEHTEVILFGLFQNRVEYDALGAFRTVLFGERLFDLIINWNEQPSPNLIVPKNTHQAEHLRTVMRMQASALLLQCVRIDPYFAVGQKHGTRDYRYVNFVACLVRPDPTAISWHDCPRVVLIEESALRKIHEGMVDEPVSDSDGLTWLNILREIAAAYFEYRRSSIEVISSPAGN